MPYTAVKWSTLRSRLQAKYEGVPFWTPEDALNAVNEALRTFNLLTGRWRTVQSPAPLTVANQYLYTAAAALLYRTRIAVSGLPLTISNLDDLRHGRHTWRSETTTTGGDVPTRPMIWVPVSLRSFYLWPADAAGGLSLTIDGIAATPVLATDDDTIDLGQELESILLGYALHLLTFSKGGPYFAATQGYFRTFLLAAAEENDQIKTSQVFRRVMAQDRLMRPLHGTPTLLDALVGRTP